jgi:hypothetical protein
LGHLLSESPELGHRPRLAYPGACGAQRPSSPFLGEVAAGKLPQFTFLDPDYNTTSEENPQDIEVGERFIAQVVDALIPRADLAQDGALHHLRRAWRLLRPRAAAARDQARFDPTDAQPGRRPRR